MRARLCMDVRVHGHQKLEAFGCEEVGWAPLAGIGQLHSGQPRRGCVFTCASLLCGLTDLHVIGKLSLFLWRTCLSSSAKGSCLRDIKGLELLFVELGSRNKMNKSRSLMWGFHFPLFLFITIMFLFFVAKCSVFERQWKWGHVCWPKGNELGWSDPHVERPPKLGPSSCYYY